MDVCNMYDFLIPCSKCNAKQTYSLYPEKYKPVVKTALEL